jgi:hypothetical protein
MDNKGFVIMAQGDDYVTCAKVLEASIKRAMPDASVTIITTDMLPYGDQDPTSNWKLINDWQVYEASPYEYTIKLEADMYLPQSIDYWWDVLKDHDVVVSTSIRNFKQEVSDITYYRKFILDNNLPDCYNAITYFRKSDLAKQFFETVRNIFENWEDFRSTLKCNVDETATTDWVYAIACHILGVEKTTLPQFSELTMIHMKQYVNGAFTEDWTETLIYEILPHSFRISSIAQRYPVHYHVKRFANTLLENLNEW